MRISSLFNQTILPLIGAMALGLIATTAGAQLGTPPPGTAARLAAPTFTVEPYAVYTGVAHVANGASLRDVGTATIRLRGMPSDASVIAAFLYWDFTSLTAPTSLQSNVIFSKVFNSTTGSALAIANVVKLYGTQIGAGGDPCWFGGSNFAYRANVTNGLRATAIILSTCSPARPAQPTAAIRGVPARQPLGRLLRAPRSSPSTLVRLSPLEPCCSTIPASRVMSSPATSPMISIKSRLRPELRPASSPKSGPTARLDQV